MTKEQRSEAREIEELLTACMQEEGYVIPYWKYAEGNWVSFDVVLRNGGKANIKIEVY